MSNRNIFKRMRMSPGEPPNGTRYVILRKNDDDEITEFHAAANKRLWTECMRSCYALGVANNFLFLEAFDSATWLADYQAMTERIRSGRIARQKQFGDKREQECIYLQYPIHLGDSMPEAWRETINQQRGRKFLDKKFKVGEEVVLTSFVGGKWYDMTRNHLIAYWKIKAKDLEKKIPYFENELVPAGRTSRLALELDLKSETPVKDWQVKFDKTAMKIVKLASKCFEASSCKAHVLTRPPYQDAKKRWKYGLHLVFERIIVTNDEGERFTAIAEKLSPYVDGIYRNGVARLRPAFSRKKETHEGGVSGTSAYTYRHTITKKLKTRRKDYDFFQVMTKTSLCHPNEKKKQIK